MTIHHVLTSDEIKNRAVKWKKKKKKTRFSMETPEFFIFLSHFYAMKGL